LAGGLRISGNMSVESDLHGGGNAHLQPSTAHGAHGDRYEVSIDWYERGAGPPAAGLVDQCDRIVGEQRVGTAEIFDLGENPVRKPETVYGITSLTAWPANPAEVLAATGHGGIETASSTRPYVRRRPLPGQDRLFAPVHGTRRNIAMSLLPLIGCGNVAQGVALPSGRLGTVLALNGI